MHPINILSLNRRISFINVGKYKKNIEKQEKLDTKRVIRRNLHIIQNNMEMN